MTATRLCTTCKNSTRCNREVRRHLCIDLVLGLVIYRHHFRVYVGGLGACMKCPVCDTWTSIKETRQRVNGKYRRYQCGNLHTFGTMESLFVIYDEEFKKKKVEKQISRLRAFQFKKKEPA